MYLAEHGNLVNHLIQALKAESLYKKDVDYAVIDDEVKIIDEFTGRILEGRRWSEGLHQAIEAKEGVAIQEENQTVATITYQNYFRKYDKLAGMTGTALTEATEFNKIYELHVVEIPTNRPIQRADKNDQIFKTKDGKWAAVVREIEERHAAGQPILVGTISVEVSELLSEQLKEKGIKHTVLNAKPEHAEREGEIVAEAGQPGAVTIATNMAGRGVDIKLGGNAEHLTTLELVSKLGLEPGTDEWDETWDKVFPAIEARVEQQRQDVVEAGGLFILGTERHESRRIDNQLRGRSGRQGDPGESRFYLSAEDDLVRLFAGDRIYRILDRLGPINEEGEEEALDSKMLTKQIEGAQKKVEDQNFLIRKRTLEYDDVMNQQREVIYEIRDRILEGDDMSQTARAQISDAIERLAGEYLAGDYIEEWDLGGLFTQLEQMYPVAIAEEDVDPNTLSRESLIEELREDVVKAYDEREEELGEELMRALERYILLQIIDERWREHLHDMDYLREGIHLRGFAQIEPIVAYKNEGFEMFNGPDQLDLGGVRALHLPRRGRGRGPERRRWRRTGSAAGSPARRVGGRRRLVELVDRRLPVRGRRPGSAERARRGGGRPGARRPSRARPTRPRRSSTSPCRSSSGGSPRTSRSGVTTPAGADRARSTRSAMAPSASGLRDQLKLLADYL